jgi:arginase
MGAGPDRLLAAGALERLRSTGHQVELVQVRTQRAFEHEVGAYFAVQEALAEETARTVSMGAFPFILGGNCGCVIGATAGLGLGDSGGVVWFDAHGDANTPESTESGFLDGMPVAILTGRCWANLASSIRGFRPLPSDRILLAGVRSIDQHERDLIDTAGIPVVDPAGLQQADDTPFTRALANLGLQVPSVHVHIDLDVIDTRDGNANEFATDDGPPLEALAASIEGIGQEIPVNSLSLTSYNPTCDTDGRAERSALRLLDSLAALVPAP